MILGLLRRGPLSGYDVKYWVDRAIRFLWAASYGQIYPELRRLEQAGLVRSESVPQGSRQRNVYRLTTEGEAELRAWLLASDVGYEMRDVGLLKLFLADALSVDEQLELVRRIRSERQATLDRLRAMGPEILRPPGDTRVLVYDYGVEFHEWVVDWCDRAERRVAAEHRARERGAA